MGPKVYPFNCLFFEAPRQKNAERILVLLLLSLGLSFYSKAQTSFSFSQISSGTEVLGPGRGTEFWNGVNWNGSSAPTVPSGNTTIYSTYYRFNWSDLEGSTQGSYNWTKFDNIINYAIDNGSVFSFGIMTVCEGCSSGGLAYPTYVHNLMQSESTNSKDWYNAEGNWVPNWNSNNYLSRFEALLNALAAHINSTSRNGKNYKDAIYYIDIRGYGNYGEWQNYPYWNSTPSGRVATSASLQRIIDAHRNAFPNNQLVCLIGAYDSGNASMIPLDVTYYVLTATNNYGRIGWRRDNWGDAGYTGVLENNAGVYNSVAFNSLIMNMYKYAPVVGEPSNDPTAISRNCGTMLCDLPNEVQKYHAASFGNGNYPNASDGNLVANVRASSLAAGYRIILTGGSMTTTLSSNSSFNISLNWQNIGVAPTYDTWNTTYELRNSSGTAVWSGESSFSPRLFIPQSSATTVSDNFTLSSVASGTYSLYLIVRDPSGYNKPLPLAINGRNSDGSYLLRSNITVGSGSSSSPVANAGSDQTITLPTSSTTLNGGSSTGTISSYAWSEVSGPNTATLSSPSSSSTTVSGLIQGSYVFKLSINGGASTDQVNITVNAASSGGSTSGAIFTTQTPSGGVENDGQALELGTKFRSSVAGTITGIRFYKSSGNSGTHTGELYNSSGTRLAQAVFSGESSSGWQTATFSTPVAISANTTYIAAYFSSSGNYTSTTNYFTSAVTNGSLTALADGTDGSNGVYTYTSSPAYPSSSYQKSNYWVDAIFTASSSSSSVTSSGSNIFTTQTPSGSTENDGQALELGVKFRASVAGTVTGIRFYKTSGNSGTHIGELYSSGGTRLAQATFTNETSTGWQTVTFSSPVSITANSTYVAAYYSSSGNYVSTTNYFGSAVTNGNLTALADGTSGVNGVYLYTSSPAMPVNGYLKSNYWVDVVFNSSTGNAAAQQLQVLEVAPELDSPQAKLIYHLEQNYPNPSLSTTKINYGLPTRAYVELLLYDMQGRPVKIMVNETKEAGDYQYELNTGNLPKGIYYYRMRSGYYVSTKKMMVL